LRKSNTAVDVINFGEETQNIEKLEAFVSAVNNENNSHLVTVPPGPHILSDMITSSPILGGESGVGPTGLPSEFDEDPELALALKASLEEEKARQDSMKKTEGSQSSPAPATTQSVPQAVVEPVDTEMFDDEALLAQALELSKQVANSKIIRNSS